MIYEFKDLPNLRQNKNLPAANLSSSLYLNSPLVKLLGYSKRVKVMVDLNNLSLWIVPSTTEGYKLTSNHFVGAHNSLKTLGFPTGKYEYIKHEGNGVIVRYKGDT